MLRDSWKNKVNDVDDILAEDINEIAKAVISLEEKSEKYKFDFSKNHKLDSVLGDSISSSLYALLNGRVDTSSHVLYAEDLNDGDIILINEQKVPSFWFEKTDDVDSEADIYVYTSVDGEKYEFELRVISYDHYPNQVGLLHIMNGGQSDIGDLESALDKIIEIQESLIGGDGA